ncbi:hypothetical protein [Amycolatopsis sp. NPDC051371]|uniref:hypothetical protein n=1 Tax=Amycolatopsis sp. NPDC051371 TaxID=3155800 RepID=UPI0034120B66
MDEVLSSALRDAVFGRLDYLDRLAEEGDQHSKAALADSEIVRLTGAFRALLADHEPDEHGRCRSCAATPWRHRARCMVWKAAYRDLVGDAVHRTAAPGRHSLRPPRPAAT